MGRSCFSRYIDRHTVGRKGGQIDRWADTQTQRHTWTGRKTGGQSSIDKHMVPDWWTERQRDQKTKSRFVVFDVDKVFIIYNLGQMLQNFYCP